MRTVIDIDESQIRELDRLARKHKLSRAALIREAVEDFLNKRSDDPTVSAFGLWNDRKIDGPAYQDKVRSEW